jgi:hypothetical protein
MLPPFWYLLLTLFIAACTGSRAAAQVVINEIHYHPVEEPAFDAQGMPALNLTEDVHEFVELRNAGSETLEVSGWKLTSGIDYTFPAGTTIAAGGYLIVAKNPARLATVYGLAQQPLGPYAGRLGNNRDTVRIKNAEGVTVDAVNYSANFPWPVTADGMGASEKFTGLSSNAYQYRGRSLQRVSVAASSNDPANWIASRPAAGATPFADLPTPGGANLVSLEQPRPVVVAYSVQRTDESPLITPDQDVVINCTFSSGEQLSQVELQYFVEDVNSFAEARVTVAMTSIGNGQFTVAQPLPKQAARSIVRYRVLANRGSGSEVVLPRADDPAIVPVSPTGREAWLAYFVEQPGRAASRPIYDFFIWDSAAVTNDSVDTLARNIDQNPRRIVSPDPPGYPRDDPPEGYPASLFPRYNPANYPADGQPKWNGTVPAIFVHKGVVYDVQTRYHGSIYRRSSGANSWKISFPGYKLMDGKQRILVTDKAGGNENLLGYELFHEAELPAAYAQRVDFYRNNSGPLERLEITDNDEETLQRYQTEVKARNPQSAPEFTGLGTIYKSKGIIGDEGPYGWGNGQLMPSRSIWTRLDRYIWTYPIQNNEWVGHTPFANMLAALWSARGDAAALTYPNQYGAGTLNIPRLRAYLQENWDIDKVLSYLAVRNWCSPWDDKFHNYLVYQQANGKWTLMPWDFDAEFGNTGDAAATNSILAGKRDDQDGSYSNNFRGPNFFKDTILRAFDAEYRQRLFVLNNTLLAPANLTQLGLNYYPSFAAARHASVNSQLNLGPFHRPGTPVNSEPASGASALSPMRLAASPYTHSAPSPVAHAKSRWEIRSAEGSYKAPVWKVTSATDLTSIAIPFNLLKFGTRYFWRVTYFDAQDHPSFASAETAFVYGAAPSSVTLLAIDATTQWKYNKTASFSNVNSGPNDPAWWASTTYNDSNVAWLSGALLIGDELDGVTPEPIRTRITRDGRISFYFRKRFTFPGSPTGATVRMRHIIDDGAVIYINGVELPPSFRFNMPAGEITASTGASPGVADATYSPVLEVPAEYFVQGENVIAVEVHQNASNSSDVVFGLSLEATIPFTAGDITINEVMADNRRAFQHGGRYPDYVELFNNTPLEVDITGWSLTDRVLTPNRYVFPEGTRIPGGGYLLVFCDVPSAAPGLYTGFGLSSAGQGVALIQGSTVKDYVEFGPQAVDFAIGRVANGSGGWTLVIPSAGSGNSARALGSPSTVRINEWIASPARGEDWLELYNPDANPVAIGGPLPLGHCRNTTLSQIPALSFIGPKGFAEFVADGTTGGNRVNFKLSASGESIVLTAANGTSTIDSVTFGAQSTGISQGRLPDGFAAVASFPGTATPGSSNYVAAPVVINEVLANSTAPLEDAIELFNPSATSVEIGGWWLSDSSSELQKFRIPLGTTIAPGGFKVFYESDFNPAPGSLNSFALKALGDQLILSAVDGEGRLSGFRSQVTFGASEDGVSFGRVPITGGVDFWPLLARTFGNDTPADLLQFRTGTGGINSPPKIGPLILNEFMYHPPDGAGGADNGADEFIELHNVTTSPVEIRGWSISGAAEFVFPAGAAVLPGDYVLVVSFDPAIPAALAAFRARYTLPQRVQIFGPYSAKLPNGGAGWNFTRLETRAVALSLP